MVGHGVLLVPVPPLEDWVRARTAHYDPAFVSDDPGFVHAHVTVLGPCPVDRPDLLAAVASAVGPFDFRLGRLDAFPDGTVHLLPEPDDAFRALTDAARRLAPDVDPYWGRFEPVPHLTLDRLSDEVSLASMRELLAGRIPATCRADRLLLTWWEAGNCRVLDEAPLSRSGR